MTVVYTIDGGRATITIDRPDALNALNSEVVAALSSALRSAVADPAIRVVVLAGSGTRAFCAGADLRELSSLDVADADTWLRAGHELLAEVWGSPKPVVSVVDGLAIGGGFEIVLASTLAIASTHARFALPEVTLGLIPGLGGTQRLLGALGRQRALRMMLTGQTIDAREAYELGLLSASPVEPGALPASVDALVDELLHAAPLATQSILELCAACGPFDHALMAERRVAAAAIASGEGSEGIAAFDARRLPAWASSHETQTNGALPHG